MPSYLEKFFPDSAAASTTTSTNLYCKYSDQVITLTGSILYAAALPTVLGASYITQKYGRKATLTIIAISTIISAAIGAGAENLAMIFICRIFAGISMGLGFQAPVIYIAEITPNKARGGAIFVFNFFLSLGGSIAPIINRVVFSTTWGWRLSIALSGLPGVVLLLVLPFLPETPNSLLQRGQKEKAEIVLKKLRGVNTNSTIQVEFDSVVVAAQRTKTSGMWSSYKELFKKEYLPAMTISITYPVLNMLAGMNVIGVWATQLFLALGATTSYAFTASIIVNAVGLITNILSAFLIDRVGRKKLLIYGGMMTAASLLVSAVLLIVYLPTGNSPPTNSALIPAMTALLAVYRAALSSSLHPLSLSTPAEVQPLAIRSAASAVTTFARNFSSFLIVQFALPLMCSMRWGLYLLFASVAFFGTLFAYAITPETKGILLEDIDLLWQRHWLWGRMKNEKAAAERGGSQRTVSVAKQLEGFSTQQLMSGIVPESLLSHRDDDQDSESEGMEGGDTRATSGSPNGKEAPASATK
jgi:sugar porter (SP) family MFS transporter